VVAILIVIMESEEQDSLVEGQLGAGFLMHSTSLITRLDGALPKNSIKGVLGVLKKYPIDLFQLLLNPVSLIIQSLHIFIELMSMVRRFFS